MNDLINSLFEMAGAIFATINIFKLLKDKSVMGVYWPATAMFALWGYWNVWYYPSLDQMLSFYAGILLASANTIWVALAIKYRPEPNIVLTPAPKEEKSEIEREIAELTMTDEDRRQTMTEDARNQIIQAYSGIHIMHSGYHQQRRDFADTIKKAVPEQTYMEIEVSGKKMLTFVKKHYGEERIGWVQVSSEDWKLRDVDLIHEWFEIKSLGR